MDVFPAFLWCFLLLLVSRRAQCQEQTTTITQAESLGNETTTQPIDRPLLKLIKQLVNFADNNSKTVLTNTELKDILAKEFDLEIWNAPHMAEEIYMAVLKRFLKSWPRWDIIDQAVQNAKTDDTDIERKLFEEYLSLKAYLKSMLELAKGPTQAAYEKLNTSNQTKKCRQTNEGVLEILCSRSQLNKIFFQYPNPNLDDTIFNVKDDLKQNIKINAKMITFKDILYWPGVNISINYSLFIEYSRKNLNELQHTLVNKKLRQPRDPPKIPTQILSKTKTKYNKLTSNTKMDKAKVIEIFENALNVLKTMNMTENLDVIKQLINLMLDDASKLDSVNRHWEYKYYLNKYPYIRRLSTPVVEAEKSENSEKFDLELEEYILPAVIFELVKIHQLNDIVHALCKDPSSSWLKIECTYCDKKFESLSSVPALIQHFLDCHSDEKDWWCSNCGAQFSHQVLAGTKWRHICAVKKS